MNYYLTPKQYAVLDVLIENTDPRAEGTDHEGISPKKLSTQCCCKISSIQLVLNELLNIGLIFKRFGADIYAPSSEALKGMAAGTIQSASDEQIRGQNKCLGTKLRKCRKQRKLTREDVATKIGVANSAYYAFEQGVRPIPLQRLRYFSWTVNVPLDYFLEEVS